MEEVKKFAEAIQPYWAARFNVSPAVFIFGKP